MRTNCGVSSSGNLPSGFHGWNFFRFNCEFQRKSCARMNRSITWNFLSAARTVGQLANVFAALGGRLVGSGLWVQRLWSAWRVTVDVDKLLGVLGDDLRWLQCWTGWTSMKMQRILIIPLFLTVFRIRHLRRVSSTAGWRLCNSWLSVSSILRVSTVSARLSLYLGCQQIKLEVWRETRKSFMLKFGNIYND